MREIKFRAFGPGVVKSENTMIYNVAISEEGNYLETFMDYTFEEKEGYILMQNTGLKDTNGKEIYEGDIVKYVAGENYENTGVVTWVDEKNSFNLKTYPFMCGYVIHNEKENKTDKFEWDETNYMQVIGNIYENPELLGNEK